MVRARVAWTLLCVGWSGVAAAQGARLEVRGESTCITAEVLRERVARYLDAADVPSALAIEVDVAGESASFRLVRAGRVLAERRFERAPETCAEWRDAIAVSIAVAIEHAPPPGATGEAPAAAPGSAAAAGTEDPARQQTVSEEPTDRQPSVSKSPSTGTAEQDPKPEAASEPEPDSEAESALEPSSPPEPARRPSERWMVHAGGAYMLEALPAPAAALRLGAERALVPALRIGLAGLVTTRVEVPFESGRVESQLFGGQLTVCLNTPIRPMLLLGCAGTSAGLVRASGRDYTRPLDADMLWVGAFVRAGIELPSTGTLALRLLADARANLLRPDLRLNRQNAAPAHRDTSPIGGSFAIELVLRLD